MYISVYFELALTRALALAGAMVMLHYKENKKNMYSTCSVSDKSGEENAKK